MFVSLYICTLFNEQCSLSGFLHWKSSRSNTVSLEWLLVALHKKSWKGTSFSTRPYCTLYLSKYGLISALKLLYYWRLLGTPSCTFKLWNSKSIRTTRSFRWGRFYAANKTHVVDRLSGHLCWRLITSIHLSMEFGKFLNLNLTLNCTSLMSIQILNFSISLSPSLSLSLVIRRVIGTRQLDVSVFLGAFIWNLKSEWKLIFIFPDKVPEILN